MDSSSLFHTRFAIDNCSIDKFRRYFLPKFPLVSSTSLNEIVNSPLSSTRRTILNDLITAIGSLATSAAHEVDVSLCWKLLPLANLDAISRIQGHILLAIYFLYSGNPLKIPQCLAIKEAILKDLNDGSQYKLPELAPLYWVCMRIDLYQNALSCRNLRAAAEYEPVPGALWNVDMLMSPDVLMNLDMQMNAVACREVANHCTSILAAWKSSKEAASSEGREFIQYLGLQFTKFDDNDDKQQHQHATNWALRVVLCAPFIDVVLQTGDSNKLNRILNFGIACMGRFVQVSQSLSALDRCEYLALEVDTLWKLARCWLETSLRTTNMEKVLSKQFLLKHLDGVLKPLQRSMDTVDYDHILAMREQVTNDAFHVIQSCFQAASTCPTCDEGKDGDEIRGTESLQQENKWLKRSNRHLIYLLFLYEQKRFDGQFSTT